jgi:hypothetical protein
LEGNLLGSDRVGQEATLGEQIKVWEHTTSIPTALFGVTNEMEKEGTEANLREHINEIEKKLQEKEQLETALHR